MRHLATAVLLVSSAALASPSQLHLLSRGSLSVPAAGSTSADDTLNSTPPVHPEVDLHAFLSGVSNPNHVLPSQVGEGPSAGISLLNPGFSGFDALDHADQRLAGTGKYANTQFSLEPPDQGLCVGNGFVVETVNTAFAVYDSKGKLVDQFTTTAGNTNTAEYGKGGKGLPKGTYHTNVWANGGPVAPPHATVQYTVSK